MTAVVDFRGYRLLALSELPIGEHTLVYGSDTQGRRVVNTDDEMSAAVETLGRSLWIKEHTIGYDEKGTV